MHAELVIAKLVVVALGFIIALQAFRSYRRGHGTPMLYVAIGFVFISVGSVLEGFLFELDVVTIFQAGAIQSLISAIGMLFVLYSLYAGSMTYSITISQTDD